MKNPTLRQAAALLVLAATTQFVTASPFLWNVATPGANPWNVNANWLPNTGNPGTADVATFGQVGVSTAAASVNNIVSVNTTVTGLNYTNMGASAFHVTQIPDGVTLAVTGSFTNGGLIGASTTFATTNVITGGGTFLVTANAFQIGNNNSSGGTASALLDLSGLSYFVYNASGGTFNMGNVGSRSLGYLNLASVSNYITAGTLNINVGATSTGTSGSFILGPGTNIINAGTINLAAARNSTPMQFTAGTGGLRIRGTGGTDADRATMVVGNRNTAGTSTITVGSVLVNGHPVDMKLATLTLGTGNGNGTPIGASGIFQFDQGIVDVTTINMAVYSGNATATSAGSLTVGANGLLIIGNGGVSLVNQILGICTGTMTVNGGTVNCAGSILKTTSGGVGSLVLNGGSLTVQGTIGSTSARLDNLSLTNTTLAVAAAVAANASVAALSVGGTTNIISISSMPPITSYPAQFQLISYTSLTGDPTILGAALPASSPSFQGYISNNVAAQTIDLVLTAGPAPAKLVTWGGGISGDWDTTTLNWTNSGSPALYAQNDFTLFNDSASGTTTLNLVGTITPGSLTVSNSARTYEFGGSGALAGSATLAKQGSGSLILNNSGNNTLLGGILISAGTLQLGKNNANGNLPATAAITNNGNLAFNRNDSITIANVISGSGTLANNGPGTLTLSAANSFAGDLTVNGGTVRPTNVRAPGTGGLTVNTGGTLVLIGGITNPITMAGGTLGITSTGDFNGSNTQFTAAATTTSLIQLADPQNPSTTRNINIDATLHGSGNLVVINATNVASVDGGQGFRLRGTNVLSDFSGTITFSNNVKGEVLVNTNGPFSPAGTGKFRMVCGAFDGTNVLTGPVSGGYSEFNLRNNSPGDTVVGNDVELLGTGAALLNPIGTAPAGSRITMGNLKLGNGQELGVYLAAPPAHVIVFPTVTLTGGTAKFSPRIPGFGATTNAGSDLELGTITESAASGIIMAGSSNLTLTAASTYSGPTAVNAGILRVRNVSGSATGAGAVSVAAGATLAGDGIISGPVSLNGTVSPGVGVGLLTTGPETWNSGGNYLCEVIDAAAAPGVGFDSLTINGGIDLEATAANPFIIQLTSLSAPGVRGNVANFDNNSSYSWRLAALTGTVTNFDATRLTLSTTNFSNDLAGGAFYFSSGLVNFTNNHPPVANPMTVTRPRGVALKIPLSQITNNSSDPDGDPVAVASVSASSTNGVNNVTTDGTYLYYLPGANGDVTDLVNYTIRDVRTAYRPGDTVRTAAGSILITIAPDSTNQTQNIVGISTLAGGSKQITFAGIPGYSYRAQAADSLAPPINWQTLATNVAGSNGLWNFTDLDATNHPSRFYRTAQP